MSAGVFYFEQPCRIATVVSDGVQCSSIKMIFFKFHLNMFSDGLQ